MVKLSHLQIGGAFMTGGHVFQAIVAFAINLILVRYIPPSEFGRFALVFAEASLFYAVISIRTNTLIIRAAESVYDNDAMDVYFNAALQETLLATVLIFVWLWLTGAVGPWEVTIALTLAVRHWTVLNKAFYERGLPYKQLSFIETGASFSGHAVSLVVVLIGGGWVALVLREVMQTVVQLLALVKVGGLTIRRVRPLKRHEYKRLYLESRGVWLDGLLEGTFSRLTIMTAGYVGGDALAGLVFQAQRLATAPHLVLAPFVNRIVMNWFSRTEDPTARRQGRNRAVWVTILPLTVGAIAVMLFAEPLVPWLLGADWQDVSPLLIGMAGLIVFMSPFEVLRSYCIAIHHTRVVLFARVAQHIGFFVPVALAMAGVMSEGAGLAYGFSAAFAVAFIGIWWLMLYYERRE